MNDVPENDFLELYATYFDWANTETKREVERLKAEREWPDGFIGGLPIEDSRVETTKRCFSFSC